MSTFEQDCPPLLHYEHVCANSVSTEFRDSSTFPVAPSTAEPEASPDDLLYANSGRLPSSTFPGPPSTIASAGAPTRDHDGSSGDAVAAPLTDRGNCGIQVLDLARNRNSWSSHGGGGPEEFPVLARNRNSPRDDPAGESESSVPPPFRHTAQGQAPYRRPRFAAAEQELFLPGDHAADDPTGDSSSTPIRCYDSPQRNGGMLHRCYEPPLPPIGMEDRMEDRMEEGDAPHWQDATLTWMNERPYNVLGFLGRGGFGIVHKVELLTPLGWTVKSDAAGYPEFGETKGFAELALQPTNPFDEEPYDIKKCGGRLNRSGFSFALKKIKPGSEGEDNSDWDDCLREVKLMQALKKVLLALSLDNF